MGCEFQGSEFRKSHKYGLMHERVVCVATTEPCLIDEPMGWTSCTRRQFLLANGALNVPAEAWRVKPSRPRRPKSSPEQAQLGV